jgi:nucleoside-diphosphate kinase
MAERTLIIIKPDGIQRHLAGEIIGRFEKKGFKLVAARFFRACEDLARRLYAVHRDKDFYEPLVKYLSSGPVLVTVWEGRRVVAVTRKMMGATFGYEAQPGTIRGDFGCSQRCNLVHGSDSAESAQQEIELFFTPEEILDYELSDTAWVFGKS